MAPFGKGGGPKDRGIFASNRHFHKSQNSNDAYAGFYSSQRVF